MPLYKVQAPDGRSVTLEGDSPPTDQDLDGIFASLPQGESTRQRKPSTQATIDEREAFGQQLQKEAQAPVLDKLIAQLKPLGKTAYDLLASNVEGVAALPEMLSKPSSIPATVAEGTRRAATDLGSFINSIIPVTKLASATSPQDFISTALGAVGSPFVTPGSFEKIARSNTLQESIAAALGASPVIGEIQSLAPKTLTPEEIQRAFEESQAQKGIQDVRNQVDPRFASAQPEVAEALAKDLPLLLPIKALRGSKGASLEADVGRSIRTAIKHPDAQMAQRIEKAGKTEIGDIFSRNPNADKAGAMPMEGFAKEVDGSLKDTGNAISELRAQVGGVLDAGDQIAKDISAKADSLENAGVSQKVIDQLRTRAKEQEGKMTNINSLQEGVTMANWKRDVFDPKTTGEQIADEIIARKGGSIINKELGAIKGEEGAALRKKWSNLKTISDGVQMRLNKLFNNAPEEVKPALWSALQSTTGIAGAIGILRGYVVEGSLAIASQALKKFSKNAQAELKNPNSIISKMYDELRKNPPPSTLGQPAIMPLKVGGVRPQPSPTVPSEPTLQEFIQSSLRRSPVSP